MIPLAYVNSDSLLCCSMQYICCCAFNLLCLAQCLCDERDYAYACEVPFTAGTQTVMHCVAFGRLFYSHTVDDE
jgi:hypothetical protein